MTDYFLNARKNECRTLIENGLNKIEAYHIAMHLLLVVFLC